MSDILSLAEIEGFFPGQWVVIGDPETDDCLELQGGRVLRHGEDRDEVYGHLIESRPRSFVLLYAGVKPQGREFALLDSARNRPAPDSASERRRDRGHVAWLVALAVAGIVYLETTNAPLSVAAFCIKAGWNEFSSGWWLLRSDPLRPRARACFWFYAAASLCKICAFATGAMLLCGALVSQQAGIQPPRQFIVAGTTMFVALGLSAIVGLMAVVTAWKRRLKVWVHPRVRRACGGDFTRMGSVAQTLTGANRAFFVVVMSTIVPAIAMGIVALCVLTAGAKPNDMGPAQWVAMVLLFGCPLMIIPVIAIVLSKTAARSAAECWPACLLAFGRMIPTACHAFPR